MSNKLRKIKFTDSHFTHLYGISGNIFSIIGLLISVVGLLIALKFDAYIGIAIAITIIFVILVVYLVLKSRTIESVPIIAKQEPVTNNPSNDLLKADDIFLYEQLEIFYQAKAIVLLAQDYRVTPLILGSIKQLLQNYFDVENTYHLVPVAGSGIEPAVYFTHLGQQFGLAREITSSAELESILDWKLRNGEHLCLLISSLENGDSERANELASSLRNLLSYHKQNLHLLFCGGQKLAELRFANGDLSLLNTTAVGYWRELTVPDVQQLYQQAFAEHTALRVEQAEALLAISGGHPKLLEHCFSYCVERNVEYTKLLLQEDVLVAAFTPFLHKPDLAQQVLQRLAKLDIGPATTYIFDDLLRKLYWMNLLVKREVAGKERLMWRCEVIRQAGISILGHL